MKIVKFNHRNDLKNPFLLEDILKIYPLSSRRYNVQIADVVFVNRVLSEVASMYELESFDEICSDLSSRSVMTIKSLIAYFLISRTSIPIVLVGAFLGGRDHSTVLNLLSIYEKKMLYESEDEMRDYRFSLRRLIRNVPASIVIRERGKKDYAKLILLEKLATKMVAA